MRTRKETRRLRIEGDPKMMRSRPVKTASKCRVSEKPFTEKHSCTKDYLERFAVSSPGRSIYIHIKRLPVFEVRNHSYVQGSAKHPLELEKRNAW